MKNISLFYLFSSPLMAHPSLLFTENEVHMIHQNIAPQNELNNPASHSEGLHLSGIVYVNADHWSLWLNNRRIGSDTPHQIDGFHIEEVTPLMVKLSWVPPQSTQPILFTLHPNQMFLVNENKVIFKAGTTPAPLEE